MEARVRTRCFFIRGKRVLWSSLFIMPYFPPLSCTSICYSSFPLFDSKSRSEFFFFGCQSNSIISLFCIPPHPIPCSISQYHGGIGSHCKCMHCVLCQHGLNSHRTFPPFTTYISCPIHVNCLANNDTFSSLSRS